MKRTLFAVFLAVMLVAALVFIATPDAKAATILTPADATDGKITISSADQILDLQGANLTVVFTENVELSVIDTTIKQEKDGTNNAGTLTVEGAGSIAAVSVDPTSRMRFLAIATDGVYSAYPFNLAISQAGINTIAKNPDDKTLEEPATCIRASFMAFKPVIDEIDAYGFIVNGNKYAATKKFVNNITHAYADLQGTLRESIIDNPVSIQAYMTINKKDYVSSAVTFTPREVLKKINKENVTPTDAQKERIENFVEAGNPRVGGILSYLQLQISKTEAVPTNQTLELSFADKAQRTEYSASRQVWEQNGIKLTNDKGSGNNIADYSNPARFYKNSKISIEAPGITKIEFTCNSTEYATALKNSIATGTVTVNGKVVTVELSEKTNSFTVTLSEGQVRMDSLIVTTETTTTITTTVTATCGHLKNASEATCLSQAQCLDCDAFYGETGDHIGGTATCTAKAICSNCEKEYGEVDTENGHNYPANSHVCANGCGINTECIDADPQDNVCDICQESMGSADEPELVEKTYSYTFTAKQFSANGTMTLNGIQWTLAGNGGYCGYDGTKGQQFGSGNAPYKSMTLTSAEFTKVTKIVINTSGASSIVGNLTVSVGGTEVGTITLTKTATSYTFDVSELTGEIVLSYTQTSSKAIYIKSISVDYKVEAE